MTITDDELQELLTRVAPDIHLVPWQFEYMLAELNGTEHIELRYAGKRQGKNTLDRVVKAVRAHQD